jgi:hypothetical protein
VLGYTGFRVMRAGEAPLVVRLAQAVELELLGRFRDQLPVQVFSHVRGAIYSPAICPDAEELEVAGEGACTSARRGLVQGHDGLHIPPLTKLCGGPPAG